MQGDQVTDIHGSVEPGFEGVREAFARNFTDHRELGAAYAVYHQGRKVVDLWGGVADRATGAPYAEDTLQLVFSATKGATAACANLLVQRGELDVDEPVATYWPEFKANGKERIPVRWLLCHKAGLPYVDAELTLEEVLAWDPVVDALAAAPPLWEPGTGHGYHAITYGWLVGEVVRRITGRSLGRFFAEEIAGPLGLDFWIGLPADVHHRVAPLVTWKRPKDPQVAELMEQFIGPETMLGKALGGPSMVFSEDMQVWNSPAVWSAEIPAANGVTDARSLARFYAGLTGTVEGGPSEPILHEATAAAAATCQTEGPDKVLSVESTIGLGFFTASPSARYGCPSSFGHTGAGGAVGFTDPDHRLAVGYVMNRMVASLTGDPRSGGLVRATYDAIGVEPTYV